MDAQDRWNDALLDAMRGQSDPAADEAIDALADQGPSVAEPVLEALERGDEIPPSALPEEIRNFLAGSATLPPWADLARLRLAAAFFEARAPEIAVVLACYAIPAGHAVASAPEARPAPRREILRDVLDTARTVGDLMAEGALEPGGDGIEAAQRIRLRHAALRHRRTRNAGAIPLRQRSPRPLDQEAMVGWVLSLSHVVLDGLAKLGLEPTAEEADAYVHVWNVAGRLMGVSEAFLPSHPEDAGALWHAVQHRKLPGSPEAQTYTMAIVEMMEDIVSHDALDALPSAMMRHLMGDALADGLGVPASAISPALFRSTEVLVQLASRIVDDSPLVAQIARRLGAYFQGIERGRPGEAAPPSSRHPLLSEPPAASSNPASA
jgi:hypothetical protein